MFCPKCGITNPDSAEFCGGCGYRFDTDGAAADMSAEKPVGSPDVPAPKKSIFKRLFRTRARAVTAIILAVVILACSLVGIGSAIRSCVIREHATGYVLRSYGIFLKNATNKSEFFRALKKADKNLTAKARITDGKIKYTILTLAEITGDALFSYDKSKNQYCLTFNSKIDGSRIGVKSEANIKAYTDFKNLNLYYYIDAGENKLEDSYYASMTDLKNSIEGSIFDPKKENVKDTTQDKVDDFVNDYETAYNFIKDDKLKNATDSEEKLIELEKVINSHCDPKVESEKINVFGRDVDCDVVTHTVTKKGSVGLYRDLMNKVISFAEESGIGTKELKAKRDSDIDRINKELKKKPDTASDTLVLTHYVNKSNGEIAKCIVESHCSDREDETTTVEFTNDGDTAVKSTTVKGDSSQTKEFRRTENGDEVVDSYSNDGETKCEIRYNKSSKEFTMTAGDKTYSGTAEMDGKEIKINCGVDFSPTIDVPTLLGVKPTGYLKFEVTVKPESEITPFKGEKNFFTINTETFNNLFNNIKPSL